MLIGAVALVGCSKDDGGNEGGDPLVTNVTLPPRALRSLRAKPSRLRATDSPRPTRSCSGAYQSDRPHNGHQGYDYHSDGNRTDVRSARRTTRRRKFGDPQTRRLRNDAG